MKIAILFSIVDLNATSPIYVCSPTPGQEYDMTQPLEVMLYISPEISFRTQHTRNIIDEDGNDTGVKAPVWGDRVWVRYGGGGDRPRSYS